MAKQYKGASFNFGANRKARKTAPRKGSKAKAKAGKRGGSSFGS